MVYKTQGVCSREIYFDVEDHKVVKVRYIGGCSGNTQGVAALVEGMDVDEAIRRMEGIRCGRRPTSCPDQLARALKQYRQGAPRRDKAGRHQGTRTRAALAGTRLPPQKISAGR